MKIIIDIIPHEQQRYPTVGDWQYGEDNSIYIKVSDTFNWQFNALVGIHELIEAMLCKNRGIREEEVTEFDIEFEDTRESNTSSEPGDHPEAPYHNEHVFAMCLERLLAHELRVNWEQYEEILDSL
jgi:hypothetical protein